jgi:hypothetical protein
MCDENIELIAVIQRQQLNILLQQLNILMQ